MSIAKSLNGRIHWTMVFVSVLLFSGLALSVNVVHADQVITTIPLGYWPTSIGVNPNTNMIYVAANPYTNKPGPVIVIDGNTNTVVSKITVGPDTQGVGVNPNTNMIYVATAFSQLYVIDGATNSVVSTLSFGSEEPIGVGVNPNTNRIYVSGDHHNSDNDTVSVIDGATNSVVSTIPVGNGPHGVGVNPNTNMIYVADSVYTVTSSGVVYGDTVSVIDGTTNSVVDTIPVGNFPIGVGINSDTNKIYVTNAKDNTVSVIDGTTNSVVDTIPVGNFPTDIGVNPNTNKVYVDNDEGKTVSVINSTTNSVINTIPVGTLPTGNAVNQNTNRIYVANNENQTVSVIDGSPQSNTTSQLRVNSQDNNGNTLTGFQTELYTQNGTQIGTGYTPYNFILNDNQTYTVHVENNGKYVFDHWSDTGSTNASRAISISSDGTITAAYRTIPQSPTNLAATAISSSQINLSWNAPTNNGGSAITGYKIERSTDGGSTWSTIVSNTGTTGTSYSDSGLSANTTYYYMVSAINSVGTGNPSNTTSATTPILTVAGTNVGPVTTTLP